MVEGPLQILTIVHTQQTIDSPQCKNYIGSWIFTPTVPKFTCVFRSNTLTPFSGTHTLRNLPYTPFRYIPSFSSQNSANFGRWTTSVSWIGAKFARRASSSSVMFAVFNQTDSPLARTAHLGLPPTGTGARFFFPPKPRPHDTTHFPFTSGMMTQLTSPMQVLLSSMIWPLPGRWNPEKLKHVSTQGPLELDDLTTTVTPNTSRGSQIATCFSHQELHQGWDVIEHSRA